MEVALQSFWKSVNKIVRETPHLRRGQAAFIHLSKVRPDLAEKVRATKEDPFYVPGHQLKEFSRWLELNW